MMLIEESTVLDSALPVAAFRAHLRMGSGFAEDTVQDGVLVSFLRAAMAAIEARTGKIVLERDFSWNLTGWRDAAEQVLPVAPVSAVSQVVLIDRLGNSTVADPATYRLIKDSHQPRLRASSGSLPSIPPGGAVDVHFTAGYGPAWDDVPPDLAQAMLMLAAHYYEYRHDTTLGRGCMPFGVTSLIERYRPIRIGAGGQA